MSCSRSSCSTSGSSLSSAIESSTSADEQPPLRKKKRYSESKGGRFKASWTLPPHIEASTKGDKFANCRLCNSHFSVSHGGFNNITRHVKGAGHLQRLKDAQSTGTITSAFASVEANAVLNQKVISAEIMMCQFIAMHNLSFLTADHLSGLVSSMFPDSKIASGFACKHTKTKAIICDAIDPHFKKSVLNVARSSPFNLCDESNERGNSVKLLTILIRLFEPQNASISTRHLDTIGITELTAEGTFPAWMKLYQKRRLICHLIIWLALHLISVMS